MIQPTTTLPDSPVCARNALLRYAFLFLSFAVLIGAYYAATGKALAFTDIGLDTFSYFYPLQILQSEQLREYHDLTWSFKLGLGGYIGAVVNPIQFAFAWLPDAWQLAARLPMYFIKLFLAGAFFYGYLRRVRFDPDLACIGALAYAFSNYGVINEQWDALFILQFAAYLYFLESHFRTGKRRFAVAAGLAVAAAGPFELYVFALLTMLYLPARAWLMDCSKDARPALKSLLVFGTFAALGSLLLAVIQFPNILYLLDSPRVSGDHSKLPALIEQLLSLNERKTVGAELAGLFGKDLLGTGSAYQGYQNYFEAPGFYVGLLMLVCAPQLLAPTATRRERHAFVAAVVLLAGYILWPAMRHVVYGFGHTGFRISTLWVSAGILVIGLAGLRRASHDGVWRPGLVIALVSMLACLGIVLWRMHDWIKFPHLVMVLAFTGIYLGLLWAYAGRPLSRQLLIGMCFIVAGELFLFAAPAFIERTPVSLDGESSRGRYDDATLDALALVRQHAGGRDFYRVEKTYESVFLNDPMVQGYHGTKSYFFHGKSITRFVDELKLHRRRPRANYISAMNDRPAVLDLLGVRYLLARDAKLDANPTMTFIGEANGIRVYQNLHARGISHLYRHIVSEDVLADTSPKRRDRRLLDALLVDDPDGVKALMRELDARAPDPSNRPSADWIRTRLLSDKKLDIDVAATDAAAMLVAMPYAPGWLARIDGQAIPMFRAQYGLTAMVVPPGKYMVQLRYTIPGRRPGAGITLGAAIVLLLVWAADAWRRRRAVSSGAST